MKLEICSMGSLKTYQFVVILSEYRGKIMLSRKRAFDTWETQGGHIESGETPLEAAKRELYEESGAVNYTIAPVFDYSFDNGKTRSFGMAFTAVIEELAPMPESEMEEVAFFDSLPRKLTYPEMTPGLLAAASVPCRRA